MESNEVPRTLTVGSRKWSADRYDWDGEWGWKTPFQPDDYADGIGPEDYEDIDILGGDVPQYFVFVQEQQDGTYEVSISATNGPRLPRPGMAGPIGGDDFRTAESLDEAMSDVRELMVRVS